MHHFDFHRLGDPGIIRRELAEILDDPQSVVVVEWGDAVKDVLPAERLTANIVPTGENSRKFEFHCPAGLSYLIPEAT